MNTHQTVVSRALTWGRVRDKRIRHAPAAIRRLRADGDLRNFVLEALDTRSRTGRPRPGLDSGRAAHGFLGLGCTLRPDRPSYGWFRYAAARRSLALAGYADTDARVIARQAALCDRIAFSPSVNGTLPPAPTTHELNCYRWDEREGRTADEARTVRQWSAWLSSLHNDDAPIGRRMRRWLQAGCAAARREPGWQRGWYPSTTSTRPSGGANARKEELSMSTYTARYAHGEGHIPGTLEIEADSDAHAIEQAKNFVREGVRNGTWINMSIQGGAFAASNQHGEVVSHTTRY